MYDVLGDSLIGRSLRELLIDAIRYGDLPETKERQLRVIDAEVGERLRELVEAQSLTAGLMGLDRLTDIRDNMERARTRKLQPASSRPSSSTPCAGWEVASSNGRGAGSRSPASPSRFAWPTGPTSVPSPPASTSG